MEFSRTIDSTNKVATTTNKLGYKIKIEFEDRIVDVLNNMPKDDVDDFFNGVLHRQQEANHFPTNIYGIDQDVTV